MVAPIGSTGTPDYGKSLASNPTIQSYDAGEDTTRLLMGGGANSRGGRWLWASGFESGMGEWFASSSDAYPIVIDTTTPYMGKNCALLRKSAVIGVESNITKYLASPYVANAVNCRYGIEGMVSLSQINACRVTILGRVPSSPAIAVSYWFAMRLDVTAPGVANLQYQNSAGVYVNLGAVGNYIIDGGYLYHYMKVIFDANTGFYSRILFDDLSFPMDTIPGQLAGNSRFIIPIFRFNNRAAAITDMRLDNVVITGDEP